MADENVLAIVVPTVIMLVVVIAVTILLVWCCCVKPKTKTYAEEWEEEAAAPRSLGNKPNLQLETLEHPTPQKKVGGMTRFMAPIAVGKKAAEAEASKTSKQRAKSAMVGKGGMPEEGRGRLPKPRTLPPLKARIPSRPADSSETESDSDDERRGHIM